MSNGWSVIVPTNGEVCDCNLVTIVPLLVLASKKVAWFVDVDIFIALAAPEPTTSNNWDGDDVPTPTLVPSANKTPLLIFYGSNDKIISYEGIKTVFDSLTLKKNKSGINIYNK